MQAYNLNIAYIKLVYRLLLPTPPDCCHSPSRKSKNQKDEEFRPPSQCMTTHQQCHTTGWKTLQMTHRHTDTWDHSQQITLLLLKKSHLLFPYHHQLLLRHMLAAAFTRNLCFVCNSLSYLLTQTQPPAMGWDLCGAKLSPDVPTAVCPFLGDPAQHPVHRMGTD